MSIKHLYEDERPSVLLDFANSKTLDPRITFERQSVGTYVDELGIIRTAVDNEARFDHNPETGESLGLLIEEERTNLRTYSTAPNASNDYRIYTTAAYNTTETLAPDGTNTATKITGNGTIYEGFDVYPNTYGQYGGVEQTFSFYVKPVNATSIRVAVVSSNYYDFNFTTETGTLVNGTGGGFEKLANGWYRVWYTGTKSNQYWYHGGYIDSAAATSNSVYIWGVQLENGAFPTSYIPTSGSTVQRLADEASIIGTNFTSLWTPNAGTWVVGGGPSYLATSNSVLVRVDADSSAYSMTLNAKSSDNKLQFAIKDTGTTSGDITNTEVGIGSISSLAWDTDSDNTVNIRIDTEGLFEESSTPRTLNTSINKLQLGNYRGQFNFLNGHISRFAYYNTRLSDTTLEALTK